MYDNKDNDKNAKIWQFYVQSVHQIEHRKLLNTNIINHIETTTIQEINTIQSENLPTKKVCIPDIRHQHLQYERKKLIKIHHHYFQAETNAKKRMKKGHFVFNAKIDLHGQTQNQAFDNLQKFITYHYKKQIRHLLVITGRGRYCYQKLESLGILIKKVPEWLKDTPLCSMISVIEQASIYDGGEGALYIILRKA